jgi:hypothetical protein
MLQKHFSAHLLPAVRALPAVYSEAVDLKNGVRAAFLAVFFPWGVNIYGVGLL